MCLQLNDSPGTTVIMMLYKQHSYITYKLQAQLRFAHNDNANMLIPSRYNVNHVYQLSLAC